MRGTTSDIERRFADRGLDAWQCLHLASCMMNFSTTTMHLLSYMHIHISIYLFTYNGNNNVASQAKSRIRFYLLYYSCFLCSKWMKWRNESFSSSFPFFTTFGRPLCLRRPLDDRDWDRD